MSEPIRIEKGSILIYRVFDIAEEIRLSQAEKIVSQLTGDLEFNSPQTLVAFALGLTLFVFTLALNIYALYIVRKYREQYD